MASLNLNKVILAGHLADTPELKQTTGPNPVSVCKVRLIVNRQRKADGMPGGMDGFDVIAWRGAAEFVARYFHKGQAMCVTGRLQNRSYEKNGETRWVTEIVADEINFVDNANSNQQNAPVAPNNNAGSAQTATPTNNATRAQTPQSAPQQQYYESQDDDLPF